MLTLRASCPPVFRRPSPLDPASALFRATGGRSPHLGHAQHAPQAGGEAAGAAPEAPPPPPPPPVPLPLPAFRQQQKQNAADAAAAQVPEPTTGWGTLTDSGDEWTEEQAKQAGQRPQRQIQEPAVSGVVLLVALIVGLSAAAWQISRLIVGFQSQRLAAAKPEVTVTVLPPRPSAAAAPRAAYGRRSAAASKAGSHAAESSHAGAAASNPSGSGQAGPSAGHKDQESKAEKHATAKEQATASPGLKAGSGDDVERASSPAPEPAAPSQQQAEGARVTPGSSGGAAEATPPAGSGDAPAGEAAAAKPPSEAAPKVPEPALPDLASAKPASEAAGVAQTGWPAFGMLHHSGQSSAGEGSTRAEPEAKAPVSAAAGTGPGNSPSKHSEERAAGHGAPPAAAAGKEEKGPVAAAAVAAAPEAWSRFSKHVPGELGASLQQSTEALSVRAPSAGAADLLPPGRGLPALRERAQLALRAAAAASEASQRAAAYSAAASTAASQAADAAENAAAAATDAQSALENEAEGAIVAAEERAQRAAGLARDAEEHAAHSASSAVAYQNLAQVQATVAGKAAKALAGASGGGVSSSSSNSHADWTPPGEYANDDVTATGVVKALQDAWDFLMLRSGGGGGLARSEAAAGPRVAEASSSPLGSKGSSSRGEGAGPGTVADRSNRLPLVEARRESKGDGGFSAGAPERPRASGRVAEAPPSSAERLEHGSPPGFAQAALTGISSGIKELWGKVLHLGASLGG